jgi:hypothetical protein
VVDALHHGKCLYSAIHLPSEIAAWPPPAVHPRLRVTGEVSDHPLSGALVPSSQGHHLILGSARLKDMGLKNQIRRF